MLHYTHYTADNLPDLEEEKAILQFLLTELGHYGDPKHQIQKAIDYALGRDNKIGGLVLLAKDKNAIASAAVVNKTGMSEYLPENLLIYIATDSKLRGKGIGKKLLEELLHTTEGDFALHVDENNPAIKLYERMGFKKAYLEMRLLK